MKLAANNAIIVGLFLIHPKSVIVILIVKNAMAMIVRAVKSAIFYTHYITFKMIIS
jgi:hypothetical protein